MSHKEGQPLPRICCSGTRHCLLCGASSILGLRGLNYGSLSGASAPGEIRDLLYELRREVDVHSATHQAPQSPRPSPGSSAACRARPRIRWLSTRACWTLSSLSSVTANSLLGVDTVVSLAIARWSGS